jgi:hypothetical protein
MMRGHSVASTHRLEVRAMAMTRTAEVVSLGTLSKSIDKAIGLAAKKHKVTFGGDTLILNWEILGRILREMNEEGRLTRLDVATTVMKSIPGVKGQPVVTKLGKDVLVGFIERSGRAFRF